MDAETRHRLQQNELAEALQTASTIGFTDRRFLLPALAIVAIALGYLGYKWMGAQRDKALRQAWNDLATTQILGVPDLSSSIAALRNLINANDNPAYAATARIRLAKALRMLGDRTGDASVYEEAAGLLNGVVERSDTPAGLQATALYVLAEVFESQRDVEQARATYTRLMDEPRYLGSPFQLLARQRVDTLADVSNVVRFEPGNRPLESMPATQAAPDSAPPDSAPAPASAAVPIQPSQP